MLLFPLDKRQQLAEATAGPGARPERVSEAVADTPARAPAAAPMFRGAGDGAERRERAREMKKILVLLLLLDARLQEEGAPRGGRPRGRGQEAAGLAALHAPADRERDHRGGREPPRSSRAKRRAVPARGPECLAGPPVPWSGPIKKRIATLASVAQSEALGRGRVGETKAQSKTGRTGEWPWPGAQAGFTCFFLRPKCQKPCAAMERGHPTTVEQGFSSPCDTLAGVRSSNQVCRSDGERSGKARLGHARRRRSLPAESQSQSKVFSTQQVFLTEESPRQKATAVWKNWEGPQSA